jgi:hypothetical protein
LKSDDAIASAIKRHKEAASARKSKQINRPVTVSGLCRFFNFQFEQAGFGAPPLITQDTTKKLNGFIKVLKNNYYTDADIYNLIKRYIDAFERIKSEEFFTSNNKKYAVGGRPTIRDLIICRDCIINKVQPDDGPVDLPEKKQDWGYVDLASEIEDLTDE